MTVAPTCRAIPVALIVMLAVPSCGAPSLDGAVYTEQIPVFPGAKLQDVAGGNYYDELGGPVTFESKSWFFKVSDKAKVIAFYQEKLPSANREEDDEGVTFTFAPAGAEEGEDVSIVIKEGELQISEVVKPGKRGR